MWGEADKGRSGDDMLAIALRDAVRSDCGEEARGEGGCVVSPAQ